MTKRATVRKVDIKRAIAAAADAVQSGVRVVIEIDPRKGIVRIMPEPETTTVESAGEIVL